MAIKILTLWGLIWDLGDVVHMSIVGLHYLWLLFLRTCLLAKLYIFVVARSILAVLPWSLVDVLRAVKNLSHPMRVPSWDTTRRPSAFLFCSHVANKCLFCSRWVPSFSHFYACWWFCCLKWPQAQDWLLSSDPELKETVMCRMEKIHVLGKLPSGLIYPAVGCEFKVEPIIYIK